MYELILYIKTTHTIAITHTHTDTHIYAFESLTVKREFGFVFITSHCHHNIILGGEPLNKCYFYSHIKRLEKDRIGCIEWNKTTRISIIILYVMLDFVYSTTNTTLVLYCKLYKSIFVIQCHTTQTEWLLLLLLLGTDVCKVWRAPTLALVEVCGRSFSLTA